MELADKALQDYERARSDLRGLLPEMVSSYLLSVERPVVSTFEGVKGLKEVYEDTLREKQPVYAVLTTAEVEPELFEWLTKTYTKKRAELGIEAKVIVASGEWSTQYVKRDETELRETRLVSKTEFPVQHEVDIYGNKVAFINYKKGDALIAVVINHPQIAQTMKAWFDLAWIGAKQLSL